MHGSASHKPADCNPACAEALGMAREEIIGSHVSEFVSRDEQGGPAVTEPERSGFGLRLIEKAVASDFGGKARMDFRPEGLRCTIEAMPVAPGQEEKQ